MNMQPVLPDDLEVSWKTDWRTCSCPRICLAARSALNLFYFWLCSARHSYRSFETSFAGQETRNSVPFLP